MGGQVVNAIGGALGGPWGSLGLTAASSILGAKSATAEGNADAAYYEQKAGLDTANADQARITGQYKESLVKGEATRTAAQQEAAYAANGIQVGSKTPLAVEGATLNAGAMDAAMLHFNAMREAFGLDSEAALYRTAAANARSAGKQKALASLLGGAVSLGTKWDAFKSAGALGSSPKSTLSGPAINADNY